MQDNSEVNNKKQKYIKKQNNLNYMIKFWSQI